MSEIEIQIPQKMVKPLFTPHRYKIFKGGRGCVHGDTLITTPNGDVNISEFRGGLILAMTQKGPAFVCAGPSVAYDPEPLYEVILSDGSSIKATSKHRFLTPDGWTELSQLGVDCLLLQPAESLPCLGEISCEVFRSAWREDVRHWMKTVLGFLWHCSEDYHLCDGPPVQAQESFRDVVHRLADGVRHSSHTSMHTDGLGILNRHDLQQLLHHLSSHAVLLLEEGKCCGGLGSCSDEGSSEQLLQSILSAMQSLPYKDLLESVRQLAKLFRDFSMKPDQAQSLSWLQDMLACSVDDESYAVDLHLYCNPTRHAKQVSVQGIRYFGPSVFYDVFVPLHNNYIAHGMIHHNSAKSWGVARGLLAYAKSKRMRILCAREIQQSIADSSYKLLKDQIELLGLGDHFQVLKTEIRCDNGSEFIFRGLGNLTAESIKSMEGVDICWLEEAHTISERSWELLIPTIRKPGSEIWVTYNPDQDTDPVDVRFIKGNPPDCVVTEINWNDNPWFPDVLRAEKDYLYSVDPEIAAHVWGGEYRRVSDAQILRGRHSVREFTPVPGLWDGPYHGIDFGFSQDQGTMVRLWMWEGDLYLEYEAAGLEVDTDELPALWDTIPGARDYIARADCSRPETISQVKRLGYNRVIPCKKWKGCEEDGIDFLRTFKNIVIHPRCKLAIEEAKLWSWKKDRLTGDILRITTGKFDNTWAAARYALEPIIMHGIKNKVHEEPEEEFFGRSYGSGSWMS